MYILIKIIIFICLDAEEMDKADEELKETVKHLWPLQSVKKLDLVVPPKECKYFFLMKLIITVVSYVQ